MQKIIIALALIALIAPGCDSTPKNVGDVKGSGQGLAHDVHTTQAFSVFGPAKVTEELNQCAGRAMLHDGATTVSDACFTGDSDVVLCTDVTSVNAVRCTPEVGKLSIAGNGNDLVSYARVK